MGVSQTKQVQFRILFASSATLSDVSDTTHALNPTQ
jgi:hypothetical protein